MSQTKYAFYQTTEPSNPNQQSRFDADFKTAVEHVIDLRAEQGGVAVDVRATETAGGVEQ